MSDPLKYTIGWICAIHTEYVAARAFLDVTHEQPDCVAPHDSNEYTLGEMGRHNVVIAVLPDAEYGLSTASAVARSMLSSFPNIRAGLMVGIAGGAPLDLPGRHIRLGDIVVSSPRDGHGGVFQYDFGKTIQGQRFQPTRFLNQPPDVLRAAVTGLKAEIEEEGHDIDREIERVLSRKPKLQKKYSRPPPETDKLFCSHIVRGSSIEMEASEDEILAFRPQRTDEEDSPAIFYGLIASANQLMKDAVIRDDELAEEMGILCFEMESAGLMNHFPCLVIRGICDYSDSHKAKQWQGYAAMTAAAYGKRLVCRLQRNRLENEKPMKDSLLSSFQSMQQEVSAVRIEIDRDQLNKLSIADEAEYDSHHNQYQPTCHPKTRIQLLAEIRSWLEDQDDRRVLWLSGPAGTGKSTIARTIARELGCNDTPLATFFFKRGVSSCNKASLFFSTIARQLARYRPEVLPYLVDTIKRIDNISSKGLETQFRELLFSPLEKAFMAAHEADFRMAFRDTCEQVYIELGQDMEESCFGPTEVQDRKLEQCIEGMLKYVYEPVIDTAFKLAHGTCDHIDPMHSYGVQVSSPQSGSAREIDDSVDKSIQNLFQNIPLEAKYKDVYKTVGKRAAEDIQRRVFEAVQSQLGTHKPSFLIIDALDECSSADDIKTLVSLLMELARSPICNIKVFLASRSEVDIRGALEPGQEVYENVLHKVAWDVITMDIKVFLADEMAAIRDKWNKRKHNDPSQQLCTTWPETSRLEILIDLVDGLFIFAATISRFIGDSIHSPEDQLSLIINARQASGVTDRLSPMYLPILWEIKSNLPHADAEIMLDRFKTIIGSVIVSEQPLPVDSVAGLLGVHITHVEHLLDRLVSVIDVPSDRLSPIQPFHQSFRDFLSGPDAGDFSIDLKQAHQHLVDCCLDLLTSDVGLRYNICSLRRSANQAVIRDLGARKRIPPHLRYACIHWVYHLSEGGLRILPGDRTDEFIKTHLLHWFEALSILGEISKAASMVDALLSLVDAPPESDLFKLVDDAWWFIKSNEKTIAQYPLQIYWSCLGFAPKESMTRKTFIKSIPAFIKFPPRASSNWHPHLLRSLPMDVCLSVAVSLDSRLIATGHPSGLIHLWTMSSGTLSRTIRLREPWPGQPMDVTWVQFSPGSSHIVSTISNRIQNHEVNSGELKWTSPRLEDTIDHLAVSPTHDMLATTQNNLTVMVWSLSDGEVIQTLSSSMMEGHSVPQTTGQVDSTLQEPPGSTDTGYVAFLTSFPVIVVSFGGDICSWNVDTWNSMERVRLKSRVVSPMVPIPGTSQLVATDAKGATHVFDIITARIIRTFHVSPYNHQTAVSPDSKLVVYIKGYPDSEIFIDTIDSGSHMQAFHHPSHARQPVAHPHKTTLILSQDGRFLIESIVEVGTEDLRVATEGVRIWAFPPWDQEKVRVQRQLRIEKPGRPYSLFAQETSDGPMIGTFDELGKVKLWSQRSGQVLLHLRVMGSFTRARRAPKASTVLSPNMRYLFEITIEGFFTIYCLGSCVYGDKKIRQARCVLRSNCPFRDALACSAIFSPDSRRIIVYSSKYFNMSTVDGELLFQDGLSFAGLEDPVPSADAQSSESPIKCSRDWKLVEYYIETTPTPRTSAVSVVRKVLWTEVNEVIDFPDPVTQFMTLVTTPDKSWIASVRFISSTRHYVACVWSTVGGVRIILNDKLKLRGYGSQFPSTLRPHVALIHTSGKVWVKSTRTQQEFLFAVDGGEKTPRAWFRPCYSSSTTTIEPEVGLNIFTPSSPWRFRTIFPDRQTVLPDGPVSVPKGKTFKSHSYTLQTVKGKQWVVWKGIRVILIPDDMQMGYSPSEEAFIGVVIGTSAIGWATRAGEIKIMSFSRTKHPQLYKMNGRV